MDVVQSPYFWDEEKAQRGKVTCSRKQAWAKRANVAPCYVWPGASAFVFIACADQCEDRNAYTIEVKGKGERKNFKNLKSSRKKYNLAFHECSVPWPFQLPVLSNQQEKSHGFTRSFFQITRHFPTLM